MLLCKWLVLTSKSAPQTDFNKEALVTQEGFLLHSLLLFILSALIDTGQLSTFLQLT